MSELMLKMDDVERLYKINNVKMKKKLDLEEIKLMLLAEYELNIVDMRFATEGHILITVIDDCVEQKESLADLMCYDGHVLVVEVEELIECDNENSNWFKCFIGGDIYIKGSERSAYWIKNEDIIDITELISKALNIPYDEVFGISMDDVCPCKTIDIINKLSNEHYGTILFPSNFVFMFEKDYDF